MSELGEYYRSLDEVKSEGTKKRLRSRMSGARNSTTSKVERTEEIRRIAEEGKTRLAQPAELPGNPESVKPWNTEIVKPNKNGAYRIVRRGGGRISG